MKKWLFLTLLMIFGGLMFFSLNNNKKEQDNRQEAELYRQESELLLKEQESIALYLVNEYDNIEKLTFDSIRKNTSTGYTYVYIYINDDVLVDVTFGHYGENDYSMGFYKNHQKLVENDDNIPKTLENVDISYYEGNVK